MFFLWLPVASKRYRQPENFKGRRNDPGKGSSAAGGYDASNR